MNFAEPTRDSQPFPLFLEWYAAYQETGPAYPDAMTLATVGRDGQPSARTVLLKSMEQDAFHFFTNYESRKASDLDNNPRAALLFFWPSVGRQVRVEGPASRVTTAESDKYFATRPRESQLSAYCSPQSRVIARADLLALRAEAERRFAGQPVPRPSHWGGYTVAPRAFEFWINDETRLHRRYAYTLDGSQWRFDELGP